MNRVYNSCYYLYIFVLIFAVYVYKAESTFSKIASKELCESLENPQHGLFSPFRCTPAVDIETMGTQGQLFAFQNNLKSDDLNPVILVPGLGGSSLEAELDHAHKGAWYCFGTEHSWFRLWFALEEFLVKKCWLDHLHIFYDNTTGEYLNNKGVSIRALDFGGIDGIIYLDYEYGHPIAASSYFAPIVASLVKAGYTAGKNLHGTPYDWRMPALSESKLGWYDQFQKLVEDTYASNNNKSVHLITHSMGGPTTLFFLNQMTQEWKDTYIKSFLPIAGPWTGASSALRGVVSGDNFGLSLWGHDLVSALDFRAIVRQSGGVIELLPNSYMLNGSDTTLVSTNRRNYTVHDFLDLFSDMGSEVTTDVYNTVKGFVGALEAPNVPTYCIHGYNVNTEIRYSYPDGDFDKAPIIDDSDMGDGTVPLNSLRECTNWAGIQPQTVEHKEFSQLTHLSILADAGVIDYILSVVSNQV